MSSSAATSAFDYSDLSGQRGADQAQECAAVGAVRGVPFGVPWHRRHLAAAGLRGKALDQPVIGGHRVRVSIGSRAGRPRSRTMNETIPELQKQMEAAAEAMEFEEARRLRDRINLMRGGATGAEAEGVDTSGLTRQQPGSMGLGTSQQRMTPPAGWKPPRKPDPMTKGTNRRGLKATD